MTNDALKQEIIDGHGLTPGQVASRLGKSTKTVYRWILNEKITAFTTDCGDGGKSNRWLIPKSELKKYLKSNKRSSMSPNG